MTITEAARLAQAHAETLIQQVTRKGLHSQLGRAINYGHKLTVLAPDGTAYHAIVYVGNQGPRLVAEGRSWPVELWQTVSACFAGSVSVPRPTADAPTTILQDAGSTVIYVDGSYVEADQRATIGWAFEVWQEGRSLHHTAGSFDATHANGIRNIAGECYAVLVALEWCAQHHIATVEFRYDYSGLAHWAQGTWSATSPLTQHFTTQLRQTPIALTWTKVEAHRGELGNNRVDAKARQAARERLWFTDQPAHLPVGLFEIPH